MCRYMKMGIPTNNTIWFFCIMKLRIKITKDFAFTINTQNKPEFIDF